MRNVFLPFVAALVAACHATPPPASLAEAPPGLPPSSERPSDLGRCAPQAVPEVARPLRALEPAERAGVAERFVDASDIPWDHVQVTALGWVEEAILDDEHAVVPDDATWGERTVFWQTFLRRQDPVFASTERALPEDFPEPASRPVRDITLTLGAGSVYLNWAETYEEGSVHYRARRWGHPGGGWPAAHTGLEDAALTCLSEVSLPTQAHATITTRACPRCNEEPAELDFVVGDLAWERTAALFTDGSGHYSPRWVASARPLAAPMDLEPLANLRSLTWADARIGALRLDANTGEDLSDRVCRPFERLANQLICGPDEDAVDALEQLLRTPTKWSRGGVRTGDAG